MDRQAIEHNTGGAEGQPGPCAQDVAQEGFFRESQAFDALLPSMLGTRQGRFVAVYEGQVVDEDEDEFALARRMEVSHRSEFVLIRRVCGEEVEDHMVSPEAVMR